MTLAASDARENALRNWLDEDELEVSEKHSIRFSPIPSYRQWPGHITGGRRTCQAVPRAVEFSL